MQLLYSYLLVENPFSLESQPSAPTKEKRFAYALYLDLLYLLTKVAAQVGPRNDKPLAETRFIRKINADERIKSLNVKYREEPFPFEPVIDSIAAKVKESAIYKRFLKAEADDHIKDGVWKEIFDLIVMPDPELNALISRRENYTLKGVDRMRQMIDGTFTDFYASADNIHDAINILDQSMAKTRELYFRLLALPIAITELREREIDNAQYKLLKSASDINPSLRFVENEYVKFLRTNEGVQEGIKKYKIDWLAEDEGIVRSLLKVITQCEQYKEYLEFPVTDFKNDCELWRNLYKNIIFVDESFLEAIEDRSVFWNDDIDVLGSFILKSIKKLSVADNVAEAGEEFVLPMFKDEEDSRFGAALAEEVIRRKDYYRSLITESIDSSQWEMDRMAFMDAVILMTALAEILTCPTVPLTVTFNEYIEIAKYYSTPKSGVFINGLLGQIVADLREKKLIHKTFNNN